tara:strand:+ start:1296 stop:1973 length:678 start_codon:yes stop_codon:yes gene_type:complete
MSKLKLPHASGNSMSIAAPATNPASDLELKLPATVGTANQVLANGSTPGTLEFANAGNAKITRVGQGTLAGADSYTYTGMPAGIVQFSYQWYNSSPGAVTSTLFRLGSGGSTTSSGYYVAQAEVGDGSSAVTRSPRTGEIPIATDSWEGEPGRSQGRIDCTLAHGDIWTWKMQNYYYATASSHYVNMFNTGYVDIGGAVERAVVFSADGSNFDYGNVYLTYTQIV